MQNAGIIHYALFWNDNSGLQYTYFVNNGQQTILWTYAFRILYIKWYKFYSDDLSVLLGSKQGETLYNVFILKCFNNKYKYRTLHGGCY